jgi:hypothetical protein
MSSKLMNTLKTKVFTSNDVRIALVILTLALFLLGAGAPSDGGGIGGF